MRGCLSLPFRLLSLAVLVALGWIAWENRASIRRWVHRATAESPRSAAPAAPVAELRRTGLARLDSLRRGRADSVVLGEAEVQALFAGEVADRSDGVVDSVSVELGSGSVVVRGRLDADRLPPGVLSQLAEWVAGREPVEAHGSLGLLRVGTGELRISQVRVRGVPLPRAAWTRLISGAVEGGEPGSVTFPLPAWVTGLRVRSGGAVMYGGRSRP